MPQVILQDSVREHEHRAGDYFGKQLISCIVIGLIIFFTVLFGMPPLLSFLGIVATLIYMWVNKKFRDSHKKIYHYED